jgi:hypothetical protein
MKDMVLVDWHAACYYLPRHAEVPLGPKRFMETKQSEVIAVLLPEADATAQRQPGAATMIVRRADGQFVLETIDARIALAQQAANTGCFRKGKPILDPTSREVLGYEMEEVPCPIALAM